MSEALNRQPPEISPDLELELRAKINEWMPELAELLPEIPLDAEIIFNNKRLISYTGTGGFAKDFKLIELAFDSNFIGDKDEQMINFKGSLFHEFYHLVQGFVGNNESLHGISALETAIYEGSATKFEVLRAVTNPSWSQYPDDIKNWIHEIVELGNEYDYKKWKFYDPETNRRWILYRSGCYIVDQAILKSGKRIEELAKTPPMDIFMMSGIELI
jgi:hypothetical protein